MALAIFASLVSAALVAFRLSGTIARGAWPPPGLLPPPKRTFSLVALSFAFGLWGCLVFFATLVSVVPMSDVERQGYGAAISIGGAAFAPFVLLIALLATLGLSRTRFVKDLWLVALVGGAIAAFNDILIDRLSVSRDSLAMVVWSLVFPFTYAFTILGMALHTMRLAWRCSLERLECDDV